MFIKNRLYTLRKRLRKLDKIAFASLILAGLSFFVDIRPDFLKRPVMSFTNVPIAYLINNEYYGYYDLYTEAMYNNIEFPDKFATAINIANLLSNDIQLDKIYIDVSNIKRDYSPYFNIYSNVKEDGVYIDIHNCGWGDAENINFTFICNDEIILNYINKDTINIYIEKIALGETISIPFIFNNEISDIGIDSEISFFANCTINSINAPNSIKNVFYYL